jgi:hypothetical protein
VVKSGIKMIKILTNNNVCGIITQDENGVKWTLYIITQINIIYLRYPHYFP